MPTTALACPDKFRGSLTAAQAAAAMARGLRAAGCDDVRELPLADGGEGTLAALLAALGGERRSARVTGPAGTPVTAEWGLLPTGTAVVEMAQASGLALAAGGNDPIAATTRGTGELIALAFASGAREMIVGVGGSATTDGGLGALQALDWSLSGARVVVACDVSTPFLEAARVYGPQKGAGPAEVEQLMRRLERLAELYLERTGVDVRRLDGGGAAGGLAGGLAAIGAELRPGFDVIAEAVGFAEALGQADLVVTGEGRLDGTSFQGKVVGRVLMEASRIGVARFAVIAGTAAEDVRGELPAATEVVELTDLVASAGEAVEHAEELVERAARRLAAPGC